MRLLGLDEEEIAEKCLECPPVDVDEENRQLLAILEIQKENEMKPET